MNISAAEQRRRRAKIKELSKLARERGRQEGLLEALRVCDDTITFLTRLEPPNTEDRLETVRGVRAVLRLLIENPSLCPDV